MIGKTLGHYEVLKKLGAGGMGEVYLAQDTTLGRRVALKVLPQAMAGNQERLERFRREAKTLASLNHPNIVTVYSVESTHEVHFLTMELLEGKTLAEYVPKNGVELEEFFRIAIPLADALSAAHDGGVVHRDLKPSNIFVTRSHVVKVVDFGLAKHRQQKSDEFDSESPTDSLTGEGRVLGTIPYMSPEQLQGEPVDQRSDLFSVGIVLYQLATGHRPFKGTTSAQVISSILRDLPTPVDDLNRELPHHVGRIVALCLEKDPEQRFQSAKDLRNELTALRREVSSGQQVVESDFLPRSRQRWKPRWLWAAVLAAGLATGIILSQFLGEDEPVSSMRIPMAPPPGLKPSLGAGPSVAISPDGSTLAYVMESGTSTQLYVKGLEEFEARPLPDTEGARSPAFSPDGAWIVFFDEDVRQLKKVSFGGGNPQRLTDADGQWGLTWATDDTILFTSTYSGLLRVSADGGEPETVTSAGRMQHFWPTMLPDGETVLFSVLSARGSFDDAQIAAVPLAGGSPKVILESGYYPHYSKTGHLIFVQKDAVFAAPFDLQSLEITGPAEKVLEGVWTSSWTGYADFAFSDTGTLIYVSGGPDPTRAILASVDRDGDSTPLVEDRRPYRLPRFSPDGKQIVLTIFDEQVDVWTFDLLRESFSRQTDSASWDGYPLWRPDSDTLVFASMREGLAAVFQKDMSSDEVVRLFAADHPTYPRSWSTDGNKLTFDVENPDTGQDIWIFDPDSGTTNAFLDSPYNESNAQFSPDGSLLAYQSDETGQGLEIYVRPYPEVHPDTRISTGGGRSPHWGPDGRELFYLVGGRLMSVSIANSESLEAGQPVEVFKGPFGYSYDVSPDGQSFVMLREMAEGDPPLRINLITHWPADSHLNEFGDP